MYVHSTKLHSSLPRIYVFLIIAPLSLSVHVELRVFWSTFEISQVFSTSVFELKFHLVDIKLYTKVPLVWRNLVPRWLTLEFASIISKYIYNLNKSQYNPNRLFSLSKKLNKTKVTFVSKTFDDANIQALRCSKIIRNCPTHLSFVYSCSKLWSKLHCLFSGALRIPFSWGLVCSARFDVRFHVFAIVFFHRNRVQCAQIHLSK